MSDDDRQILQRFLDSLFRDTKRVRQLDVVLRAEVFDLPSELVGIVGNLPPGMFTRQTLANQLNSAIVGHGWSRRFGTVD